MRQLFFIIILICSANAIAQKGTAPPGFYPPGFQGDTWTGEVTSADEDKRDVTLTHGKGDKAKTFTAHIPDAGVSGAKDGSGNTVIEIGFVTANSSKATKPELPHLRLADLIGRSITVYYINREKKDANGEKIKFKEVFKLIILSKE